MNGTNGGGGALITITCFTSAFMGESFHPVVNWSQYNQSLIDRGSLTFWVDASAMDNWFHQNHHGRRGRSQLDGVSPEAFEQASS